MARATGPQGLAANTIGNLTLIQKVIRIGTSLVAGWLLFAAVLVVAVIAMLLWPENGAAGQSGTFALFLGLLLAAAAGAVVHIVRSSGTADTPGSARRFVWVPIISVVCAALAGWSLIRLVDNSEVDVAVTYQGEQPLDGKDNRKLTLTVRAPAADERRDRLRLSLTIRDDRPDTPTCVHKTRATLTALTANVTPQVSDVAARSTVDYDLGGRQGDVRFEIYLRTDPGCTMRVEKAIGTLHNG
ncbi:hypothetical protein ACFWZ2_19245 [Streptomyces sp. NPDC059002]|uniref:hypothetical protein n=1 Tax=Streptomyces sp. NPDC059002 TaxID=3346690 RepID=UPI0036972C52